MDGEKFDQNKYIQAFNKEHYGRIAIQYPKDMKLKERIKELAERDGVSVNQWILRAIKERLEWYE